MHQKYIFSTYIAIFIEVHTWFVGKLKKVRIHDKKIFTHFQIYFDDNDLLHSLSIDQMYILK